MSEPKQLKMVDVAVEAVKQQITLSTGVLALLLTFLDKIGPTNRECLPWAAIPFAFTVLFGVVCLMSIAYYIDDQQGPFSKVPVLLSGIFQNLCFLFAVGTTVVIML